MASGGLGPESEDEEDDNSPTQPLPRPSFAENIAAISETRIRVDARCEALRRKLAR